MPLFPRRRQASSSFRVPSALAAGLALAVLGGCASPLPNTGMQRILGGPIVYTEVGRGEPAVVLQSGLGDGRGPWAPVVEQLRERHHVFVYDRPGYGDSTATPTTGRSPCAIATELRELLKSAGVKPPYLLVGHSVGGLYQYAFSRLYPDEVAGIVLVDATHPLLWRRMQVELPLMASMLDSMSRRVFRGVMQAEFMDREVCVDGLMPRPMPQVPVRVLTRTYFTPEEQAGGFEAMLQGMEPNWLPLTGATRLEPVEGAGHYIQRDQPARVVQAIDEVAAEIRRRAGQPEPPPPPPVSAVSAPVKG